MITQGSQMVLNFLKRNYGTEFTKKEIAEGAKVSFNTVNGSIRGLVPQQNRVKRILWKRFVMKL